MKYIRVFDAVLALAWATFAWLSYARRQAMLRERAFAALAGPLPPAASTVLKLESRGPAVLRWKARLCELGYDVPADDVFDEKTAIATAAYQQSLGLVGDGIAGPKTQRAHFRRRFRWFR